MKFNEKYSIVLCVSNVNKGMYGDIYSDFEEMRKQHPYDGYTFGFLVIDNKTGFVPEDCPDVFKEVEDAIDWIIR